MSASHLCLKAMIFSNVLLVFMIALQFGSYDMMINNSLRMFSGQVQIQRDGYQDGRKIRQTVGNISELVDGVKYGCLVDLD